MAEQWTVGRDAQGALLDAAVEAINACGPFAVDDPLTEAAPRLAALVGGVFRVMSPASGFHAVTVGGLVKLLHSLVGDGGVVGSPRGGTDLPGDAPGGGRGALPRPLRGLVPCRALPPFRARSDR